MDIKDANQLLSAFYLPFESGWKRLDTGVITIAVRTHMIGCTPAMIDWWLGFLRRLLHLIQETREVCVMRSRFWLGEFDPVPNPKPTPETLQKMLPDELGAGLFAHCCEEMSILASFLPTVYRIHNADSERPKPTQ